MKILHFLSCCCSYFNRLLCAKMYRGPDVTVAKLKQNVQTRLYKYPGLVVIENMREGVKKI